MILESARVYLEEASNNNIIHGQYKRLNQLQLTNKCSESLNKCPSVPGGNKHLDQQIFLKCHCTPGTSASLVL